MKLGFKHVWAIGLVLALPLLVVAVVPLLMSDYGDNGKFDWFLVGTKTGNDVEHTIAYG